MRGGIPGFLDIATTYGSIDLPLHARFVIALTPISPGVGLVLRQLILTLELNPQLPQGDPAECDSSFP